jgi:hypothetical protein
MGVITTYEGVARISQIESFFGKFGTNLEGFRGFFLTFLLNAGLFLINLILLVILVNLIKKSTSTRV